VLVPFGLNYRPAIACDTFLAPNSIVAGNVVIGDRSQVWYGSVIRADENNVIIGAMTSIEERSVITADCEHTDLSIDTDGTGGRVSGFAGSVDIGDYVTIEPGCVLRACTVGSRSIIGAGSVICEGALVEAGAIVGPGSVVPPGRRVPSGELWAGRPVEFVRELASADEEAIEATAEANYRRSLDHVLSCYPIEHHTTLHKVAAEAIAKGE
jgi:carbonic anhydrase/acetyltransferase-like protein (isoleucine patch superfamily)